MSLPYIMLARIHLYILELSRGLKDFHAQTEKWLDQPMGRIEGNLLFDDAFAVRVHKHPYIEFIQNVQMDATNAPISCTSLFHDGAGGFPNEVTMRHIVTNYIYPNTLKGFKRFRKAYSRGT